MTFSHKMNQPNPWSLVATESSISQNQDEEHARLTQQEIFVLIEVWKQLKEDGTIANGKKNSHISAWIKEEMAACTSLLSKVSIFSHSVLSDALPIVTIRFY